MATTKRKESAALFELLDKSTLKVPKNAASLKIPNWWSSRTNPAGEASAKSGVVGVTAAGVEARGGRLAAASGVAVAEAPVQERETEREAEKLPVQPRLFDPPPANVAPPSSPSIRPPTIGVASPVNVVPVKIVAAPEGASEAIGAEAGKAALAAVEAAAVGAEAETAAPALSVAETERKIEAATPAVPAAAVVAAAVGATTAVAATPGAGALAAGGSAAVATPPALPATGARGATTGLVSKPATGSGSRAGGAGRMLVPPSHPMANKGWKAPRPGAFARLPAWAMLSAVAGLIVVICVVVFIARQMNHAGASNNISAVRSGPPASGPSMGLGNGGSAVRGSVPVAESRYNPDLYYVIVWSMPVPAGEAAKQRAWSNANEYVAYLGKNNVNAVAEVASDPQRHGNLYVVVATQGFAAATAAEDYKKKIIRIGDTLTRGVWKDANPQKGLGAVGH